MIRITNIIGLFLLALLTACGPAVNSNNVKPTESSTSEIAIANLRLGAAYMERGEFEKSLEKLNKALRADPNYFATYSVLGVLYQRMGENKLAEQSFKKSLTRSPNQPSTLNNYGQFLCSLERYEEAETVFTKAADNPLYATPEIANTNAGTCAMRDKRYNIAETYFRKALEQNARVPAALIQMAEINVIQENYLSARAYIQRYSKVAGHSAKSLWLGVQTENKLGNNDALSSYALLLKNNFPDSEETKLLLESGLL